MTFDLPDLEIVPQETPREYNERRIRELEHTFYYDPRDIPALPYHELPKPLL